MINFGSKTGPTNNSEQQDQYIYLNVDLLTQIIKKLAESSNDVQAIQSIIPSLEKIIIGDKSLLFNIVDTISKMQQFDMVKSKKNIQNLSELIEKLQEIFEQVNKVAISEEVANATVTTITSLGRIASALINLVTNQLVLIQSISWVRMFFLLILMRGTIIMYFGLIKWTSKGLTKIGKDMAGGDYRSLIIGAAYTTSMILIIIGILMLIEHSGIVSLKWALGIPMIAFSGAVSSLTGFVKRGLRKFQKSLFKTYNAPESAPFRTPASAKQVLIWITTITYVIIMLRIVQIAALRLASSGIKLMFAYPLIILALFFLRRLIRRIMKINDVFTKSNGGHPFDKNAFMGTVLGLASTALLLGSVVFLASFITSVIGVFMLSIPAVIVTVIYLKIFRWFIGHLIKMGMQISDFYKKYSKNLLVFKGLLAILAILSLVIGTTTVINKVPFSAWAQAAAAVLAMAGILREMTLVLGASGKLSKMFTPRQLLRHILVLAYTTLILSVLAGIAFALDKIGLGVVAGAATIILSLVAAVSAMGLLLRTVSSQMRRLKDIKETMIALSESAGILTVLVGMVLGLNQITNEQVLTSILKLGSLALFIKSLGIFMRFTNKALSQISAADINSEIKSLSLITAIIGLIGVVAAITTATALLTIPASLGMLVMLPFIGLLILLSFILGKAAPIFWILTENSAAIMMGMGVLAAVFAIIIVIILMLILVYKLMGTVDTRDLPLRKKAMGALMSVFVIFAKELAVNIHWVILGTVAALVAVFGVVFMVVIVTALILIAGLLLVLNTIPVDPEKSKEKASEIINAVQFILDALFNFDKPGNGEKPDRGIFAALGSLGLGIVRMIQSLLGAIYLLFMVFAVIFIIILAGLLYVLAMMDVKAIAAKARSNAAEVIAAAQYILDMLFYGEDQSQSNKDKSWIQKILEWGGVHALKAIMDIIAAILMIVKLALLIVAVILVIVMYGALMVLAKIDISQLDKALSNTRKIMSTASTVADIIMEKDTSEDKSTEKSWISKLIDWGKDVLGTLGDIGSLVLHIGKLALLMGAIAVVGGLGKTLANIADYNVPTEQALKNTDIIIGAANAVVARLNGSEIKELDSDIKDKLKELAEMSGYMKTIGENLGGAGQNAEGAERIINSYIKFIDKINTIELTRLNTTTKMMEAWARIAEEISGDFEGLAEVMNDQIAPALEKLNETMSGVKEVQAQIIEQLELPVDTTSIEGGSGSPLLAGVPQTSSASRGGYGGSAPRPGKKYQVVFNEVKQI